MVNTATIVAVCVGVFSITMRYTGWFQIKDSWFITSAAALVEIWAIVSLVLCSVSITEMAIVLFSTLTALISHGFRVGSHSPFQDVARQRIVMNTIVCSYYLGVKSKNDSTQTCEHVSIILPTFIGVFLVVDFFLARQKYGNYTLLDKNVHSFI